MTLGLRVLSLNPILGTDLTLKKKNKEKKKVKRLWVSKFLKAKFVFSAIQTLQILSPFRLSLKNLTHSLFGTGCVKTDTGLAMLKTERLL